MLTTYNQLDQRISCIRQCNPVTRIRTYDVKCFQAGLEVAGQFYGNQTSIKTNMHLPLQNPILGVLITEVVSPRTENSALVNRSQNVRHCAKECMAWSL